MIVALAGRRADTPGASPRRFPLRNVHGVRERLVGLLKARRATTLVSSAACGADLVAQDAARSLGIRRIVVLPYAPAIFRERSVIDRPGDWGRAYDTLIVEVQSGLVELVQLHETQSPDESHRAFAATNTAIIERAEQLAREAGERESILAIVVWDGASRGPDDLTDEFRRQALARAVPVVEVSTVD